MNNIKELKDKHKGDRCFLLGSGPSLNDTNLSLIKDEIKFGVNTLYRGFDKFNLSCKYFGIGDRKVWVQHASHILNLDVELFLGGFAAYDYMFNKMKYTDVKIKNPHIINHLGKMWTTGKFSTDLAQGAYNGDTVIIDIGLQACYYMGFDKVYLLGVDCDYTGLHRFDGLPTENATGGGVSGNYDPQFKAYNICKEMYETNGREIVNATNGGKLEIFRRESLEELMK